MLASSMLLVALASISAPAAPADAVGRVDVLPCLTRERYERLAAAQSDFTPFVRLRALPKLSDRACFGVNVLVGKRNVGWALDGETLYLDGNANGSLLDDAPARLDEPRRLPVHPVPLTVALGHFEGNTALRVESHAVRRGRIHMGGTSVEFLIRGASASFDNAQVVFDLNGDGRFDTEDPQSLELFSPTDGYVNVAGKSYGIEVAPDGASLTLHPLPEKKRDRLKIVPGTRIPAVTVRDTAGQPVTVGAGAPPVLLYFWTANCGGWPMAAPKIAALEAIRDRGYELIGVNTADDLATFAASLHTYGLGRQIREPLGGELNRLFRVEVYPRYFLLDGDGVIRALRLDSDDYHGEIRAALQDG